jgi:hypothetical protein
MATTGGLFNRIKVWAFQEVLKSFDINTEFDNIINHLSAQYISGFSATISQMQTQLSPGGLGTELPAQSTAQEIEQLRFVIARITGLPFWYQAPSLSLAQIQILVGSSVPQNRVISGAVRASSNQPLFLQASGSAPTLTLLATPTPFNVEIQNQQYTFSANTTITGMSLAPNTNNTAVVQNSLSTHNALSTFAGESNNTLPTLTLSACGSQITALVGQYAAFQVVDGGNTEYFIGYVQSATTNGPAILTQCSRGFFFNSSNVPVQALPLTDGDTVTLLKLFYIFATTTMTITSTTVPPVYAATAPTSPGLGQYWFDITTQIWYQYNGSAFVNSNATFIGLAVTNTSACVASRCTEYFAQYKSDNTVIMQFVNGTTLQSSQIGQQVNVAGNVFSWSENFLQFVMPLNLTDTDGSLSETTFTQYYLYITDTGQQVFSTVRPYYRGGDLKGYYHRYSPWRGIATIQTEGTPLLLQTSLFNVNQTDGSLIGDNSVALTKLIPKTTNAYVSATGTLNGTTTVTGITTTGIVPGMIVYNALSASSTLPVYFSPVTTVVSVNPAGNSVVLSQAALGSATVPLLFVTPATVGQIAVSPSCGELTYATSFSSTLVPNLYNELTTTGRPVIITLQPVMVGVNVSGVFNANSGNTMNIYVQRDGTTIGGWNTIGGTGTLDLLPNTFVDLTAPAGIHTYSISLAFTGTAMFGWNVCLQAFEI